MKKTIFVTIIMVLIIVSCNQKNQETTNDSQMLNDTNSMLNDSTMMENDSTMMHTDSTMANHNDKMMNNSKMYSCSMHPDIHGKLNEKCSKCGMKLTVPVA
ncbi:hypothetical protein SAMN05444372_10539 [Flavobacterium micromati]|jgi:uncharacterized protein YcfL|uniref:Heavy metal binding domain-containing protein n=1 Tax=Flavobacterium micromati TaxID=229205 RepID=A0A1M5J4L6_9FLAO|nr:heavy metal-binding domain-containing protein [Flavobacterium micromati]SHG35516.1 hypothetical protein SAMN05444372_10539 [Flavobacterium micromati]